jgi:hypothetical protein
MLTGAGFVTVTDPAGLTVPVGVIVTIYVRELCGWVFVELPTAPHAIMNPAKDIANTKGNAPIRRFRRKVKGAPSRAAKSIIVPPFHGAAGV